MNVLFEKFLNAFDNAILADHAEHKIEYLQKAESLILELNEENENIFIGKPTLNAIRAKIKELEG